MFMKFSSVIAKSLASLLALVCTVCMAQTSRGPDAPEWTEGPIAPPPLFAKDRLIAIDMPSYVSVKIGVDPESIAVGEDGVVRYVVVMTNASGNSNAVYEGIRCASDEVKTYARFGSSGQWTLLNAPQWKAIQDNMPSRHALAFARQGGCQNHLAPSKQEILAALKLTRRPTLNNPIQ
jgi:CNP1-like family